MARPGWESGTYSGAASAGPRLPLAGAIHGQAVKPNKRCGGITCRQGATTWVRPLLSYHTTNREKLQLQCGEDLIHRIPDSGLVGVHGHVGIRFIERSP